MSVPKEWLEFLREQFPVGSRIRLREMKDDPAPIKPGSMGTLTGIDDLATFHCVWDDGRALGVAFGEDSFSVLPPEPTLLKLYMPMTVDACRRNGWGDMEDEREELDSRTAVEYADHIVAMLLRMRHPEEAERGLMVYYHGDDSVNQKVRSYEFTAEVRNGRLWGVAECRIVGALTPEELEALKETVAGQAGDGFGESAEQREIKTPEGEIYAHLWQPDDWTIQTEQEQFSPKLAEGLPKLCFSTLPGTGELICIRRGESGYYPSDWSTDDRQKNKELADYNNQRLGVTAAQRQAMECGSMHGFDCPGANPRAYEQDTPRMGGMALE